MTDTKVTKENKKAETKTVKNPYASFQTEENKETEGFWLELEEGLRIKIARAGNRNTKYAKKLSQITKKYKNLSKMNEYAQNKILAEVYSDTIIKDWGVEVDRNSDTGECIYEDGKIHVIGEDGSISIGDYTKDNVVSVLVALPDLFKIIREQADEISNFQAEVDEEVVGN